MCTEIDFKEFHSGLTRDRELMEFFGRMFGVTSINVEEFSSSEEEEEEDVEAHDNSGSDESGSQDAGDVSGGGHDGEVHVLEVSTSITPRKAKSKPVSVCPCMAHNSAVRDLGINPSPPNHPVDTFA